MPPYIQLLNLIKAPFQEKEKIDVTTPSHQLKRSSAKRRLQFGSAETGPLSELSAHDSVVRLTFLLWSQLSFF